MTTGISNSQIYNNGSVNISYPPPDSGTNLDAHYSDNMKVKRPVIQANNTQINISEKTLYSDKEATKKIQQINGDIYEGQKKEKANHEFSFKTYFKICIGLVLAAAGIAGIRKIIQYFRK